MGRGLDELGLGSDRGLAAGRRWGGLWPCSLSLASACYELPTHEMENNLHLFLKRKRKRTGEHITTEKIVEEQLQLIPSVWEIQKIAKLRLFVLH